MPWIFFLPVVLLAGALVIVIVVTGRSRKQAKLEAERAIMARAAEFERAISHSSPEQAHLLRELNDSATGLMCICMLGGGDDGDEAVDMNISAGLTEVEEAIRLCREAGIEEWKISAAK